VEAMLAAALEARDTTQLTAAVAVAAGLQYTSPAVLAAEALRSQVKRIPSMYRTQAHRSHLLGTQVDANVQWNSSTRLMLTTLLGCVCGSSRGSRRCGQR
jgi:hypothetical protein